MLLVIGNKNYSSWSLRPWIAMKVFGFDFDEKSRIPDPERLKRMYNASASTLNLVRAFATGGYADLRQVHTWNTDFVRESAVGQRYELVAAEIERLSLYRAG